MASRCLTWARRLFIPVALAFLFYSAHAAGDRLGTVLSNLSLGSLLLASTCWSVTQWIGPLTTLAFTRMLNLHLGYRELALIHVQRLPAKYLPGGVWQSVSRFFAYRTMNVRQSQAAAILVAEHFLALGTSTSLGGALLYFSEGSVQGNDIGTWALISGLAILALSVVAAWRFCGAGVQTARGIAGAIFATTLFWIGAAASFCIYWSAGLELQEGGVIRIAASYLLSWAAGFAAFFAPQGLGVFEWAAGQLLSSDQPLFAVITLAAGFRLVTIIGDLFAWALAIAVTKFDHATSARR